MYTQIYGKIIEFKHILFMNYTCIQGSKFTDFSLISNFFPTPGSILEISVNLKRSFLKGWGLGYWNTVTQNGT